MPTFEFPALPPCGLNHMHKRTRSGGLATVEDMATWQQRAKWMLLGWEPPKETPLSVKVVLAMPKKLFRRADLDKWASPCLDVVLGPRCDQWVDRLEIVKQIGEGSVSVTVDTY